MSKKNMYLIKQQNVKGNSKMEKSKKMNLSRRAYKGSIFIDFFGWGNVDIITDMIDMDLLPNSDELNSRIGSSEIEDTLYFEDEVFSIILANELLKMCLEEALVRDILAMPEIQELSQDLPELVKKRVLLFYRTTSPDDYDYIMESDGSVNCFILQENKNMLAGNYLTTYSVNLSMLASHILEVM